MKKLGWLVAALVLGGVAFVARGCLQRKAPDEKLAAHIEAVCHIAHANVRTPKAGVGELGRFFAKHAGEITGEFGDLLSLIERIPDDEKHDARALLAAQRLREPGHACKQDWIDFNDAVMADSEASEALDHGLGRLARTLQILIEGQLGAPADLRTLPERLDRALDGLATRR